MDFGSPVEVGGMTVCRGDLRDGDRHGILSHEVATKISHVAARLLETEKKIVSLCQSPDFSLGRLRALLKEIAESERR